MRRELEFFIVVEIRKKSINRGMVLLKVFKE